MSKQEHRYSHDKPHPLSTRKTEHTPFEVPTVSLHIHERIAPEAIIRSIIIEDAGREKGDIYEQL